MSTNTKESEQKGKKLPKETKKPKPEKAPKKEQKPKEGTTNPKVKSGELPERNPKLAKFYEFFDNSRGRKAVEGKLDQEEKDALETVYNKLFRAPLPKTCSNCLSDAFFEVFNLLKSDPERLLELYECEYKLLAGAVLEYFGNSDLTISNKNLTNRLAEIHLKDNPNKVSLFDTVPDNWRSRIS